MAEGEQMDEREWLACTDPGPLLEFFRERKISARKVRLFLCACCRRVWHLLTSHPAHAAMEAAEGFADGVVSGSELADISLNRWEAPVCVPGTSEQQAFHAVQAATRASHYDRFLAPLGALNHLRIADPDIQARAHLLRDIFGNPFRPFALDSSWRTPVVLALAQAAYDHRTLPAGTLEPERLAVLADALEESGCDNADILNHLRGPGPHFRGCHVIDLLLAKE
jgi:hypothetical protein